METIEQKLVEILDDISNQELKKFNWHLKKEELDGAGPIKASKLEGVDRGETVDLLVKEFQLKGATVIMQRVLKKVGRNDLVNKVPTIEDPAAVLASAEEKLRLVRSQFVVRVSDPILQNLLDKMLEQKILTDGELEFSAIPNREEKARRVIDVVRKKGPKASATMIQALCEVDPCLADQLKLM